jgi:hypothetical protein
MLDEKSTHWPYNTNPAATISIGDDGFDNISYSPDRGPNWKITMKWVFQYLEGHIQPPENSKPFNEPEEGLGPTLSCSLNDTAASKEKANQQL